MDRKESQLKNCSLIKNQKKKGESMNKKQQRLFAKKVRRWANSQEGKKAIKKALDESQRMAEILAKAREIDPETLHRPMAI